MCNCTSVDARAVAWARNDSTAVAVSIAVSVAVLGVLADVFDGHHMLVFGGVEYDDALGRAAGNPDALDRTADQLPLVGHQHDLVAVLDRERRHQFAIAAVHRHRDDALAAAPRSPVFERRRALAITVFADGQHELLAGRHFDIALLAKFDGAGGFLAVGARLLFDAATPHRIGATQVGRALLGVGIHVAQDGE